MPVASTYQRLPGVAHERRYGEVLDLETGRCLSLAEFLGDGDYGHIFVLDLA